MLWLLIGVASLAGLALALWGLHRLCLTLEEHGWIYYREQPKSGSGAGGALMELDRLTRPSVEHVVEAQDRAEKIERAGIDGD